MLVVRVLLGVAGVAGVLLGGLVLVYVIGSLSFDKDCGSVETAPLVAEVIAGAATVLAFGASGLTALWYARSGERRWVKYQWLWPVAAALFAGWGFLWLVAFSC